MQKFLRSNIHSLLVYRLLLLLLLYTLCRLLFYSLNNHLFDNITFSHLTTLFGAGLTFDISAIFYINILYITGQIVPVGFRYNTIYQKVLKWMFVSTNSLFLLFNCIDFVYFRFTLRRTTLSVFHEFANDAGNFNLIAKLAADFWWVITIWLIMVCILIFAYGAVKLKKPITQSVVLYNVKQAAIMFISLWVVIVGIRGGLQDLPPININHATLKVNQSIESNIVLNTSFTLIRTSNQKSIQPQNFYTDVEVESIYSPIHRPEKVEPFRAKNVFIIILEGFGKASIGYYAKQMDSTYVGYTPFLDSLAAQSYGFKYSFANGFSSANAVPAIIASIPTLIQGNYSSSIYANNRFVGLGSILAEKGYDCSFFHGANNGSMRFLEFSRQAGYQHYYGRNEYNNEADFDSTWGIYDEPFMQYTAQVVNTKQQPFLATLFTLSSHHPYNIPNQYKNTFPKGTLEIHEAIGYADNALRRFFETASTMPWYKNTLFILVADHTSGTTHEKFLTSTGVLSIPILFYDPSGELPKEQNNNRVVQQIDIMPSILDYLNYDKPYFSFGNSVFNNKSNGFAVSISNGTHQIIRNQYVLQVSNNTPIALYNYVNDPLQKNNLLESVTNSIPDSTYILYKAVIQQYNNRLINNKTIIE